MSKETLVNLINKTKADKEAALEAAKKLQEEEILRECSSFKSLLKQSFVEEEARKKKEALDRQIKKLASNIQSWLDLQKVMADAGQAISAARKDISELQSLTSEAESLGISDAPELTEAKVELTEKKTWLEAELQKQTERKRRHISSYKSAFSIYENLLNVPISEDQAPGIEAFRKARAAEYERKFNAEETARKEALKKGKASKNKSFIEMYAPTVDISQNMGDIFKSKGITPDKFDKKSKKKARR